MRTYYVYIMASRSRALYTGVTRDLTRRLSEHKQKLFPGFTATYNMSRLVYYEDFRNIRAAIAREKEIKAWRRSKKIALIESRNPTWVDLSEVWYGKAARDESCPQSPCYSEKRPPALSFRGPEPCTVWCRGGPTRNLLLGG